MEDYRVTQTGDEIQGILNQSPIDTADIAELKEAATSLDGRLESVEGKIPAGASEDNPLTDKQYVDDSIASASATFRGTYNEVTDLELTTDATHADIGSALDEVIELADSNDYCFVQIPTDDETPTEIESIERYKFVTGWEYEYTLNNSGFTADQWAAINSGITSGLVTKLTDLPTNAELETLLNGKANATDVYTKSETYNKTELDSMITTPDVQYVSVTATAQTTAVTDVLPATGASDTVYRVGSWDGTQYDAASYSEYAWNGSSYVLLNVKDAGIATGSDFDNPTAAQRALLTTVGAVLDGCDAVPTAGSVKPVQSGGVATKNQVYDSVVDSVVSPNLFDKTQIIENRYVKYNTGKATSSSGTGNFCTDYIPIDSEGAYADLGVTSGYKGYACYSDRSEASYTHGSVSRQATFQEGDAYVRFTGKLEDVDRFMVVKGTSADYPSAYVPFGNIGELKASTVGNSQIQNGAVDHSKLAVESVNEENLSEQYWLADGISIYGDTVKEIFFLDKAIPEGVSLTGHFYGGRVIFTASLNGNTIWTIDRQFVNYYFYNNVVYALKCSTSNIETIAAGDVVGYIVFADIDTAKAINDGSNRTVNIARVKYLLNNPTIATQTYNIKDSEIVTRMIADDAVSFNKIGFKSIAVISKNFLNEDDPGFKHQHGYYIRFDNGEPGYTSIPTTPDYGYTGFIPVSSKGLYINSFVYSGVAAGAVYDKNKVHLRALTKAQYTYQEGDGYVRWTLSENPISPYTAGQYMVWEGDSSVMPEYDEYAANDVIDPDVLPPSEAAVQDGSITEAKLSTEVKNSIAGIGVEICIPDEIPCVVGDTLRIYFRSIVKAPNPYIWDMIAVSTVGKSYPRYYEYKPTASGNKSVTFYVRNAEMKVLAQKTITLRCINHITSPSSNKNILMVGASMLQDGTVAYELNRRLTSNTGDGTPYNPTGLGLSNITFVGRKAGLSYPSIHLEPNSGWSWKDYATIGRYAYRFFVVGQVGIDVQPGAVYSGAGTLKFTVSQTDIDIDRETGTGYFTCTYSGSGTQPASGTLTLFEGEGDATITYDSFSLDSGNPFWNDTTQSLDFISYANNYCNGSIDILLCFFGMNDFTAVGESGISERIENYVKPFIRAFHEQSPNSIFIICTLYLGSINGGMATSYGASGTWNYYTCARKVWKWSELVRELAADEEFSPYVRVIDTNSSFDVENLYPTGTRTVANRSEATEVVQTNGVHTTTNGKKALADGMYEGLNKILQ